MQNLDVYSFDDLLCACAQEIIQNGLQSKSIPSTIRDWLCGKIVDTLPSSLVQQLLTMILESKDATEKIGFRERNKPDYNEFAFILYKSELLKQKHEDAHALDGEKYLEKEDKYSVFWTGGKKKRTIDNISDEICGLNAGLPESVQTFFSDDLIVQPDQLVPKLNSSSEGKVTQNADKYSDLPLLENHTNSDDQMSDNFSSENTDSDDYIQQKNKKKKLSKKLSATTKTSKSPKTNMKLNSKTGSIMGRPPSNENKPHKCKFCERSFNRNSELTKHYKTSHNEYWLSISDPVTGRKFHNRRWRGDMFDPVLKCPFCPREACTLGQLRQHYKDKHIDYFNANIDLMGTGETRDPVHKCVVCDKVFWSNEEVLEHQGEAHPKFDERRRGTIDERAWKCKECDKTFTTEKGYKNHVMNVHNKIYPFWCSLCNKGFRSSYRYRNEHQKKNHLDLYEAWLKEKAENGGKNPDVKTTQTEYGTPKTGKLYGAKIENRADLPPVKVYGSNGGVDYYSANGVT